MGQAAMCFLRGGTLIFFLLLVFSLCERKNEQQIK
jgi:hypothetical protein